MSKNIKQGWKKVKLGNIVDKISNNFNPKKEEREKYIGLEHIKPNTLKLSGYGYSDDTKSTKKKFKKGDVLFGKMRPYFRKVIQATFNGVCSGELLVLKSKDNLFQRYLFYMLADQRFIDKVNKTTGGVDRPRAKWKTIKEFEMRTPKSLQTQKKIASVLSKYDDLIENNTRRIEILEEMAQSIYKKWFVNFEFPGYEDVDFIDSGTEFGQIPEGWEVTKLRDIDYIKYVRKNIKKFEGEKIYYATKPIDGIFIREEGKVVNAKNKPSRAKKQPVENSVWFARMQDTYKVLGFTDVNKKQAQNMLLSSGMVGLKTDKDLFPFLYYTINSKRFHKKKDLYCTGTTQVSLANKGLKQIDIIKPTKNLVESFGKKVKPIIDEILLLQKQNKNLKQTRDVLLPKLMSGELEVEDLDIKI